MNVVHMLNTIVPWCNRQHSGFWFRRSWFESRRDSAMPRGVIRQHNRLQLGGFGFESWQGNNHHVQPAG